MESQQQRSTYPSPLNSPSSYGSSSTSINPTQGHHTRTPPVTPKTITSARSDPYPTTFVQANKSSFKQVVQRLTGSYDPSPQHIKASASASASSTTTTSSNSNFTFSKSSIPPIRNHPQKKQQPSSKLFERRNQLRNNLMINTLVSGTSGLVTKTATISTNLSPRHQEMILSPSMLDFPKLVLSPVTPLMEDIFKNCNNKSSTANSISSEEEDKAIAEKGFYFHPSPITNSSTTPEGAEPQLLPLFPVTTPHRVSGTDIFISTSLCARNSDW